MGLLGGSDYLMPEYDYTKPAKITDGAIYKISPSGEEKMVGFWDPNKNKTGGFRNADETSYGKSSENVAKTSYETGVFNEY